jgi:hypothetical protein
LLLPALTSLLGAWIGAYAGLSRFKRERAFERRLTWYEEVIGQITEIVPIVQWAAEAHIGGNEAEALRQFRSLMAPLGKLRTALAHGDIFAKDSSLLSRTELREAAAALVKSTESPDYTPAHSLEAEKELYRALARLRNDLIGEVRRELFPTWQPQWIRERLAPRSRAKGKGNQPA